MVAMLWLYALQICTGRCSLQDTEPLQREHPASHGDAPQGLFAPRWAEIRQQSWNRVSVTHDLWPDEVVDDITYWFDDLYNVWPNVQWWVSRVHSASTWSRIPLLRTVNYVLITGEDYQAFAERPHGLMEFGFEVPQLYTTVLPRLINLPILRTFLAPLYAGIP